MSKKPQGPMLAAVVWDDAHADLDQAWVQADGFSHSALRVTTVGWIVKQDVAGVTIFSESIDDTESPSFRARSFVPAGMVVSITPLAFKFPRKPRHAPPAPASTPPTRPTAGNEA